MTPNRSAGRIEDALWRPFLAEARKRGMSNTDAMREAIRLWTSTPSAGSDPEPGPPLGGPAS